MKKLRPFSPFFLCLFVISGCGSAVNTLQQYSKEQDLIKREVTRERAKFDLLVKDIKEEKVEKNISKRRFIKIYGEPVIVKQLEGEAAEELLYRDPLKFSDTLKVYVYFNKEERLIRWTYEEPGQKQY